MMYSRPDITGAGPTKISRPNASGELVEVEVIPAPTLERFQKKTAKRGPKPGSKRVKS